MKLLLVLVMLGLSGTWYQEANAEEIIEKFVKAEKSLKSLLETYVRQKRDKHAHVDLYNDLFCVDISAYDPVIWVKESGYQKCETPFVKKCKPKTVNACADVIETVCEVVPYTNCTMGVKTVDYKETELLPKEFTEQRCVTTRDTVSHTKMMPECRNVTKQNCVTTWETDSYGQHKWAGNEACEPVTWQECKLVNKEVNFKVPKVDCSPLPPIWYHVPEAVTKKRQVNSMTCVVKSTNNCISKVRNHCKEISFQECKEIPSPKCEPKYIHKPTQKLIHKKKCLLPDNTPVSTYHAPKAAPLSIYHAPTPAYSAPATIYHAPKPVPTYHAPKPVPTYHALKPVPTYHAPKPVPTYHAEKPVPIYSSKIKYHVPTPAPTYKLPSKSYDLPKPPPTYHTPTSAYSAPATTLKTAPTYHATTSAPKLTYHAPTSAPKIKYQAPMPTVATTYGTKKPAPKYTPPPTTYVLPQREPIFIQHAPAATYDLPKPPQTLKPKHHVQKPEALYRLPAPIFRSTKPRGQVLNTPNQQANRQAILRANHHHAHAHTQQANRQASHHHPHTKKH